MSVVLVVALAGAAVWVGNATATDKPPQSVPAIAQYIEANPTLAGPALSTPGSPTPVSPAVTAMIKRRGGADAQELLRVAGSGSPAAPTSRAVRQAVEAPRGGAVTAVVQSVGLSYGNAIVLGTILVLVSVACGVAVARRQQAVAP